MLLLTAKSETAALYKSLSGQYTGKIAFGEARGSNQELSKRFNVDRCALECMAHDVHAGKVFKLRLMCYSMTTSSNDT